MTAEWREEQPAGSSIWRVTGWPGISLAGVLACAVLGAPVADSQTLQHRATAAQGPVQATKAGDARRLLPAAAEGEYCWREPGEVIELYVEEGTLRGYLTRRTERPDPASVPMTFAFVSSAAEAPDGLLHFTTQRIHGEWYSFEGHVERGLAPTPRQDGWYLLLGVLHRHADAAGEGGREPSKQTFDTRVSLKLSATRDASP